MTFQGKIILGTTYLNLGTCVPKIKHLKTCQSEAYFSKQSQFQLEGFHFDVETLCSIFHCPNLTILSAVAADGAPGWQRDAGSRQQPWEGYRRHHQQCIPGSVGGLSHLPKRWEGPGVQPVPIQHPVFPAGMWASGEVDPPGRDSPGGEKCLWTLYVIEEMFLCSCLRRGYRLYEA